MSDIRELQRQEKRDSRQYNKAAAERARVLMNDMTISDRFDYLERKLDGLFYILCERTPEARRQYPEGTFLEEIIRNNKAT